MRQPCSPRWSEKLGNVGIDLGLQRLGQYPAADLSYDAPINDRSTGAPWTVSPVAAARRSHGALRAGTKPHGKLPQPHMRGRASTAERPRPPRQALPRH
jgi:hypothetical protein